MAILIHGLGHMLDILIIPTELIKTSDFTYKSWLLSDRLSLSDTVVKAPGYLWLVAVIGFSVATYGYWYNLNWWRLPMSLATILSVALFITWWNAFPGNVPIQANLGNVVALAMLLIDL
ncbi:MAG: hypothetical protein NWE89_00580 [Candidatus Bathyarchaeota archaeon]|nr:hypothetical protein [Candidatus Bathyarchaeota archaeon]